MPDRQILLQSVSSEFRYKPLVNLSTDIRLVTLQPALSDEDQIRCELEATDITNAKYDALSYAWGDVTIKSPILLCGLPFLVTINLERALRSFRKLSNDFAHKRVLWIDAICIDQGNDVERSYQVQRMGSIYKSADSVLVWLGDYYEPEDDSVEFDAGTWGFDCLSPGNLETTKGCFKLVEDLFSKLDLITSPVLHSRTSTPTLDASCWAYLYTLSKRSWFKRLWVIQEIALAKRGIICCGRAHTSWEALAGAARMISTQLVSPKGSVGDLRFLEELAYSTLDILVVALLDVDRTNLFSILVATSERSAMDARDRLYAIKSLLSEDGADIEVNYSKSPEAVYKSWSLKRIERTRSLDVLLLCINYCRDSDAAKLPSWVPDLRNLCISSADGKFFLLANGIRPGENPPYASGGHSLCDKAIVVDGEFPNPIERLDGSDSVLFLKGMHIDTVDKRLSPKRGFDRNFLSNHLPPIATLLEEQVSQHFGIRPLHNTKIYDAFVGSLFKGYKWHSQDTINTITMPNRYRVWRGHNDIPFEFEPRMPPIERRKLFLARLEPILATILTNSDLFITSTGLIGAISRKSQVQTGDKLYVLLGGKTPFILRPLEGRNGYSLQCPCFLYGYMNGEAISAWRNGELKLETVGIV
ncbi:heterokaryon incompatibility protein-domain-containing protein [Leptodontidium sp. MPI-SDFR-AT-0119]|nr:heterokaryon incompatibility protein-domain-containing protein [Leptodontidium sp. MPI-SDFR-AT-0119]